MTPRPIRYGFLSAILGCLLLLSPGAVAQVMLLVYTNGSLLWPTTFWQANASDISNALVQAGFTASGGSVASTDITDSTAAGRALLTAADAAAQRTSLGLGTAATSASTAFEPAGVAAADVTDSTAAGRTLLTAADAAAQRTALGLGTAATSASTAFEPAGVAAADVTDSTVAGRALLTAADAAAQRTALGLGTAATAATGDFASSGAAQVASLQTTGTNENHFRGGIISTGQFFQLRGKSDGSRNFPADGAGMELIYSPTQYIALPAVGRGELQTYDRDSAQYTDFRFNSRVVGIYSKGSLVSIITNGLVQITGDLEASGAVKSGTTNLHALASSKQAADADLDDLADGSLTGSKIGSGIDAANITTGELPDARLSDNVALTNAPTLHSPVLRNPTIEGTAEIASMDATALNADTLTLGGTNAYNLLSDPIVRWRTIAGGSYEFMGNTVANALLPLAAQNISSGSIIQMTPVLAFPDAGQIGIRTAGSSPTDTGAYACAALDTVWFTNRWTFEANVYFSETNGNKLRIGLANVINSTDPTHALIFSVTNDVLYGMARSNSIDTFTATGFQTQKNVPYRLTWSAANLGAVTFSVVSNGVTVWSDSVSDGAPWGRSLALQAGGINNAVGASTAFLRLGRMAWKVEEQR